jgi:CheY-like chemotaxis protein
MEALQRFAAANASQRPFNVALFDLMMKGMSGVELTERVRATSYGASLPILLITAHSTGTDRSLMLRRYELGLAGGPPKPFTRDQLLYSVRFAYESQPQRFGAQSQCWRQLCRFAPSAHLSVCLVLARLRMLPSSPSADALDAVAKLLDEANADKPDACVLDSFVASNALLLFGGVEAALRALARAIAKLAIDCRSPNSPFEGFSLHAPDESSYAESLDTVHKLASTSMELNAVVTLSSRAYEQLPSPFASAFRRHSSSTVAVLAPLQRVVECTRLEAFL